MNIWILGFAACNNEGASNSIETVTTVSDTTNGSFKLTALLSGNYNLTFSPAAYTNYKDTSVTNVSVTAKQNTDLGAVVLSTK